MPNRARRPPDDPTATGVPGSVARVRMPPAASERERRSAIAAELGRLGGLKGGKARASKLSAKKRAAIARKAAEARWRKRPS